MDKANISITTIVVASLALIVLIVLAIIFSGKLTLFGSGISNVSQDYSADKCEIPGTNRQCSPSTVDCERSGGKSLGVKSDCRGNICCVM